MSHDGKKNNLNAVSHGILANRILPTEDPEQYKQLEQAFIARYQPRDPVEEACVRTMVDSRWRQERVLKYETQLLNLSFERMKVKLKDPVIAGDDAMMTAGFDFCASETRTLDVIMRYETMLRRSYERAHKMLKELQADRPPVPSDEPKPTRDQERERIQSIRPIIDSPSIPADQAPPVHQRKPLTGDPFHDLELKKLPNDKCCAINEKPLAKGA